jgi:hypothetical protein
MDVATLLHRSRHDSNRNEEDIREVEAEDVGN